MARVKTYQGGGGSNPFPVANSAGAVGRARPAQVDQPKLIGDFSDSSTSRFLQKSIQGAVDTSINIMADVRKKEDARATMGMDNGFLAVENDFLFDPENGLKSKVGQDALDHMSGASAIGANKNISLVDQYRSRLQQELDNNSSTMSNLAREAAELSLEEKVQQFDKNVGKYAIAQQANADKQVLSTRVQRELNRLGDDQSPGTIRSVLTNMVTLVRDPEMGAAKQSGLPLNSSNEEVMMQIKEMETNAKSITMKTAINALLDKGMVTQANSLFKNSKTLLNGKDESELAAKFTKLGDATVALATFTKLRNDSTDPKTQSVDRRKMLEAIGKIKDPILQKSMSAYYNTMVSQENALVAQSQKTADTQYTLLKVQEIPDAEIIAKYPQLIAQLSDAMRVKIVNGQKASSQLKAAKAAGALSEEEQHIENDGLPIGSDDSLRYDLATGLAASDPKKFLEEFGTPEQQTAGLTLKNSGKVKALAKKALNQKRLSDNKAAETDTVKLAARVLDQMGYSKKVKTQAGHYQDITIQNLIGDFVAGFVEKEQRMPNAQEINAHMAPLMLEVKRPATGFFSAVTPDKTSVFFQLSNDPSSVDAEVVDISGAQDRRRIGIATGNGEKEVEQAIEDLDENGIDAPTYRQLRGRLDANDLGLAKTPDVDKAVDMALADGVPIKFIVDTLKVSDKEFTAANMEAVLEYLHDLYPDPEQFQIVVQSTE